MKLKVESRNITWKNVKKLRREGKVPAVVYSKHLDKPISVVCERNEFVKLYRKAGHSTPLTLVWDGIEELVLIHDYQLDPVMDTVIHIDFLWIKKWVKVSAEAAIVMVGEELSPIVKSGDASIQLVKDYLAIEALPKDLVKEIVVDVSTITDPSVVIFVKDLNLPEGVIAEDDWELPIVTVIDLKKAAEQEDAKEAAAEEASAEAALKESDTASDNSDEKKSSEDKSEEKTE